MVNRTPSIRGSLLRNMSNRGPPSRNTSSSSSSMRAPPPSRSVSNSSSMRAPLPPSRTISNSSNSVRIMTGPSSLKRHHSMAVGERRPAPQTTNFARITIAVGIAFVMLFQLRQMATTREDASSSSSQPSGRRPVSEQDNRGHLDLSTIDQMAPAAATPLEATADSASAKDERLASLLASGVAADKTHDHQVPGTEQSDQVNIESGESLKDAVKHMSVKAAANETATAKRSASRDKTAPVTSAHLDRYVDGTSPVKLTASGQIDWDSIDHVYYYHTRKAGGTTLVKWVRLMAWKHGKNFTKDEGPVFDHKMFEGNDRVLLVTSLRPPVDRAISSYNFDLNQVGEELSVAEFIANAHGYNTKKHTQYIKWEKRRRGWIWRCASECYSKWFGGWPTPQFVPNTEKAVETLNKFEIIWMKNLKNKDYMKWLTHRFNDTATAIPHKRKTSKEMPKLSDEDKQLFNSVNEKDMELYNALRDKWEHIVPLNFTLI